jgi:hypothetical protein
MLLSIFVINKKAVNRPKDQVDVLELEKMRKISGQTASGDSEASF